MNKYLVLVIIILLAAVLFIRHHEREESVPEVAQSSAQEGEGGVPLPPDAKKLTLPEFSPEAYQPVSRLGGTAALPPLPEISPLAASPDPCLRETKVKDVIAGYDKTWGRFPGDRVKSYAVAQSVGPEGVDNLSAHIGKYQACLSLAAGKDLCGGLPKVGDGKPAGKSGLDMRQTCADTLSPVAFVGYSLGKSGYSSCSAYFKNELKGAARHIREPEFCDAAKGGLPAISSKICAALSPEISRECLTVFPKDISGCKNEESCLKRWRIYEAGKSESLDGLPYDLRPFVLAMIDKKEEHCRPLADTIVQEYCSIRTSVDQQSKQLELLIKQAELDKELRSARETQSAD